MTAVLNEMIVEQESFGGQHKAFLENVSNIARRGAPSFRSHPHCSQMVDVWRVSLTTHGLWSEVYEEGEIWRTPDTYLRQMMYLSA